MRIYSKLLLSIFVLLLIFCEKKKKIEIKNNDYRTNITINSNEKLNPEKFFKISSEINEISRKYNQKINSVPEREVNYLLKQLDKEIQKVYKKYKITEDEFNKYSEKNYKLLENYLKKHPEINDNLYK